MGTGSLQTVEQTPGKRTSKSKVAVVRTCPKAVLDDVGIAMRLAGYQSVLSRDIETLLKINISWQHYYPACAISPWLLVGVI